MNVIEVSQEIKKIELFKDLVLNEPNIDNHFGTIKVAPRHFKDRNKTEIISSGVYNLFIAHMYEDSTEMEEFFYLTLSTITQERGYRRRTWYQGEYNKIFASGYSVDEILSDLNSKLIGYTLK